MAKVMLVEDDNNLREIYEARLQAEGYTIVAAKDGEEALAVAKAEKPDLIVSDVMMPKISGFEMLDILRNTEGLKNVRVIMLTALGQSEDQERADKLGADKYLVKSQVTLEDIVKVSHELLDDQPAAPAVTATAPAEPAQPIIAPPVSPVPTPIPAADPVAPSVVPASPAVETPAVAPAAPAPPPPVNSAPVVTAAAPAAEPEASISSGRKALTEPPSSEPLDPSELDSETSTGNPDEFDQPAGAPRPRNSETPGVETISGNVGTIKPIDTDLANQTAAEKVETEDVQTTSEEQEAVDDKIEDFIAGASSNAPGPEDATNPVSPDTATDTPAAEDTKAEDDKIMETAVSDLTTDAKPVPVAPLIPPAPEPKVAEDDDTTKPAKLKPKVGGSVTIAGKKVIAPPAGSSKPDLQELVAMEAAKEAAEGSATLPQAAVSKEDGINSAPLNTPAEAGPADPDPSSISL
jgi:CheY-like chemotaxis protein